jgi:hypothetical protein
MKIIDIQKVFEIILLKFDQQDLDSYLSMNYLEMFPIVIRSIQKLKQKLDELADTEENEE